MYQPQEYKKRGDFTIVLQVWGLSLYKWKKYIYMQFER